MTRRPTAPCKLCDRVRELCQSHIIPEFCYSKLYERSGVDPQDAVLVSRQREGSKRIQKGFWDYLLCEECEQTLNRCEAYFKRAWYDEGLLPDHPNPNGVSIGGLDHDRFRLFHLSVLWRASVASKPDLFSEIQIGPRHSTRLKEIIRNQDASLYPNAYGFTGRALTHEGKLFHAISDAQKVRYNPAVAVFVFLYAGCEWAFYVCSFTPPEIESATLQTNGSIHIPVEDVFIYFKQAKAGSRKKRK